MWGEVNPRRRRRRHHHPHESGARRSRHRRPGVGLCVGPGPARRGHGRPAIRSCIGVVSPRVWAQRRRSDQTAGSSLPRCDRSSTRHQRSVHRATDKTWRSLSCALFFSPVFHVRRLGTEEAWSFLIDGGVRDSGHVRYVWIDWPGTSWALRRWAGSGACLLGRWRMRGVMQMGL